MPETFKMLQRLIVLFSGFRNLFAGKSLGNCRFYLFTFRKYETTTTTVKTIKATGQLANVQPVNR